MDIILPPFHGSWLPFPFTFQAYMREGELEEHSIMLIVKKFVNTGKVLISFPTRFLTKAIIPSPNNIPGGTPILIVPKKWVLVLFSKPLGNWIQALWLPLHYKYKVHSKFKSVLTVRWPWFLQKWKRWDFELLTMRFRFVSSL